MTAVQVWLIAGQSNALGRQASPTTPNPALPLPSVRYWPFAGGLTTEPVATVALGYLAAPQWIGIECELGPALVADGRAVAIIKWARGSTGLAQHWLPGSGEEYLVDCIRSVRRCLERLRFEHPANTYTLAGVVWNQWEEDAKSDEDSAAYGTNLAALIAAFRAEFHPGLPFLIHRACTAVGTGGARIPSRVAACQAGQDAVAAADALVEIINTDTGYALEGDHTHYTPDAQQQLGIDTAALIISDVTAPTYSAGEGVMQVSTYRTESIAADVARFLGKPRRGSPNDAGTWAVEDSTGHQWAPAWSEA